MQFMPDTVVHETDNRLNKCRTIRTSVSSLRIAIRGLAAFHVKEYAAKFLVT